MASQLSLNTFLSMTNSSPYEHMVGLEIQIGLNAIFLTNRGTILKIVKNKNNYITFILSSRIISSFLGH